jgi:hypothetical protein
MGVPLFVVQQVRGRGLFSALTVFLFRGRFEFVFVCMAATVVRLVVVLGLCHAAVALATGAGGWHMTGGDASRSYSGPAGTPPPSINIIL